MSILLYSTLTTKRDSADPGTSTTSSAPGARTYVDALAALVPAEVLAAHAVIIPMATSTTKDASGNPVTSVTEAGTLQGVFVALIVLSILLYVVPRWKKLDKWDLARALIPALAFVGWTMLQKATAFDAVAPDLKEAPRYASAIIGAIILGVVAAALAYKADQKAP